MLVFTHWDETKRGHRNRDKLIIWSKNIGVNVLFFQAMPSMTSVIAVVCTVLTVTLLVPVTQGITFQDTGAGKSYKLEVMQDVTINHGSNNNYGDLAVGNDVNGNRQRFLVQFDDIPSACAADKIKSAKMYIYYNGAYKAAWKSDIETPFIPRKLAVHFVLKSWYEQTATKTERDGGKLWWTPYLGLDGSDAERTHQSTPITIFPFRPEGFVEFDVTKAARRWARGIPNNGLLVRALKEHANGRYIVFEKKESNIIDRYPFIRVLCR